MTRRTMLDTCSMLDANRGRIVVHATRGAYVAWGKDG